MSAQAEIYPQKRTTSKAFLQGHAGISLRKTTDIEFELVLRKICERNLKQNS